MQNAKVTPAAITILAAGAVMLIGSFLDFYEFGRFGFSAWDGDLFFPVSIIPVLCGVAMAVHVALTTFGTVRFPDRVLGFGWNQIHLALGFQAAIMMIAWLVADKRGLDIGAGFWLMLLSGIALLVGAVLREREAAPAT